MLYFQKVFIHTIFFFIISYLEVKKPLIHQHIGPLINHKQQYFLFNSSSWNAMGKVGLLLCIIFRLKPFIWKNNQQA